MYPVMWYGLPAVGKSYLDLVFTVGFAYVYGHSSHAKLAGKKFRQVCTLGGTSKHYPNTTLLTGVFNTVGNYCGMNIEDPFFFFSDEGEEKAKLVRNVFE